MWMWMRMWMWMLPVVYAIVYAAHSPFGPLVTASRRSKFKISEACLNNAGAVGRELAMPRDWAPWPGKKNVVEASRFAARVEEEKRDFAKVRKEDAVKAWAGVREANRTRNIMGNFEPKN